MGYRSQVIAGVPVAEKEKALEILSDWDDTKEINDVFYMMAYSWKWYDRYSEVTKFQELIYDDDENRFLICMGEDGAIHTEIGCPEMFEVYPNSYLESPFDKTKVEL